MDKNDYTSISTLQELQQARERLNFIIKIKESELKNDVGACKQALNPVTYLNRLVEKLYNMEYLAKYFIKGYEFVRDLLYRRHDKPENEEIYTENITEEQ